MRKEFHNFISLNLIRMVQILAMIIIQIYCMVRQQEPYRENLITCTLQVIG